jgi:SAM-dependent methyltransferase
MPEASRIEIISPRRELPFPAEWYGLADPGHFWFEWRLAAALAQMRGVGVSTTTPHRALEIGAGTGVLRDQLEAHTSWVVDIADLCFEALSRAAAGRGRHLYYDVGEQRPAFLGAYEVVVLFDVLEHVAETEAFVSAVARHLRPGGYLLVNVPALPSLFGDYDREAGHLRRYVPSTLRSEFSALDLEILDVRFWGLSLVPVLLARRLFVRQGGGSPIRAGFQPPGAIVHRLLKTLMRCETAILRRPPAGSSLLLCARRLAHGGEA